MRGHWEWWCLSVSTLCQVVILYIAPSSSPSSSSLPLFRSRLMRLCYVLAGCTSPLPPLFFLLLPPFNFLPFLKPWTRGEARRRESEALGQVVFVLGTFVSCSALASTLMLAYPGVQGFMFKWKRLLVETAKLKATPTTTTTARAGSSLADHHIFVFQSDQVTAWSTGWLAGWLAGSQ